MNKLRLTALALAGLFVLSACSSGQEYDLYMDYYDEEYEYAEPGEAAPQAAFEAQDSAQLRRYDPYDQIPEAMRRWLEENDAEEAAEEPVDVAVVSDGAFTFTDVSDFEGSYAWVRNGASIGRVDSLGNFVLEMGYSDYAAIGDGYFTVARSGAWGAVDDRHNVIIPLEYESLTYLGEGLFAAERSGKYGCVNFQNGAVIPFEYDSITGVGNGIITASRDGKTGFINVDNAEVIPFQYDGAGAFTGSLAWVRAGNKYGAVNTSGEIVISIKYDEIVYLSADMAVARLDEQYMVFDRDGYWATDTSYDSAQVISPELAIVSLDGLYGAVNAAGAITDVIYEDIYDINNGLMCVVQNGLAGIIRSTDGAVVIAPEFEDISYNGDLIYATLGGKVGALDASGREIIPFRYDLVREFKEGEQVTWFMRSWAEGLWGIIDRSGNIVMEPKYYEARDFSEGLAFVRFGEKWGYVNEQGVGAVADLYDPVTGKGDMRRGLALVSRDGLFGYIDSHGNTVVPIEYEDARDFGAAASAWAKKDGLWEIIRLDVPEEVLIYEGASFVSEPVYQLDTVNPFVNGVAWVSRGAKYGVAKSDGSLLIPVQYDEIIYNWEAEEAITWPFKVRLDGKYGYIGADGAELAPCAYDDINYVGHGFIIQERDRYGYMDIEGNQTIPAEYDEILVISDNILAARSGGRLACVTVGGEFITEFQYDVVREMTDGLIEVRRNERCGFINELGETVIPLLYDSVSYNGGDYIIVMEGTLAGVIDKQGASVIPTDYNGAGFFGENSVILIGEGVCYVAESFLADNIVEIDCENIIAINDKLAVAIKGHRRGVVNTFGDLLVPVGLHDVNNLTEELILLDFNGKYGLMDAAGILLLRPVYDFITPITDDMLAFASGSTFGLMDMTGSVILTQELSPSWTYSGELSCWLRYEYTLEAAGDMGETVVDAVGYIRDKAAGVTGGIYEASKGGFSGFLDIEGQPVLPVAYDGAWSFNDGLNAWISRGYEWMMTGSRGESILNPDVFLRDHIYGTGEMLHTVTKDGLFGCVNAAGDIIVPIEYEYIEFFDNGAAMVIKDGLYGFIGPDGTPLTPAVYDYALGFSEGVAWVRKDGLWGSVKINEE
ncbi:MAG: WG repeat-containing protein [Clostridiales bacterium]|jgi:hypothetical protein|nr:WG repeat-containing protein [Clostridiales bacterium]